MSERQQRGAERAGPAACDRHASAPQPAAVAAPASVLLPLGRSLTFMLLNTLIVLPLMISEPAVWLTVPLNRPCTVSYLRGGGEGQGASRVGCGHDQRRISGSRQC